jgi:hypothetical protein
MPRPFLDAMAVRERIFVDELEAVPLEQHIDLDDRGPLALDPSRSLPF